MPDYLHEYYFRYENIEEIDISAYSLKIRAGRVNIIEVNKNYNLSKFSIKFINYFLLF